MSFIQSFHCIGPNILVFVWMCVVFCFVFSSDFGSGSGSQGLGCAPFILNNVNFGNLGGGSGSGE